MRDPDVIAQETAGKLTQDFEGFSATPYQDSAGVWTYLYGSTRDLDGNPVRPDTPPGDQTLGLALLARDLRSAIETIQSDVHVPLTDGEEEALADFIYNIGQGNFERSTLLRMLNAGDYAGAADQFERWNMAGGKVLAGLVRRRAAERALFLASDAPSL